MMPGDIIIRNARPSDHSEVIAALQSWWDGRDLSAMLPKLFLNHFYDTSFVIKHRQSMIGFLIGFMSPALDEEAYVHFMGIHPDFRVQGLGKALYERFFDICRSQDRKVIRACTSPVNKGSVAFHQKIGFRVESGDGEVEGIPVTRDYNRPSDHKVRFTKFI